MLQPPKRVTLAQIPGREYIFIVDVSGSMYGFPLEISKKLLKDLIGNLRPRRPVQCACSLPEARP